MNTLQKELNNPKDYIGCLKRLLELSFDNDYFNEYKNKIVNELASEELKEKLLKVVIYLQTEISKVSPNYNLTTMYTIESPKLLSKVEILLLDDYFEEVYQLQGNEICFYDIVWFLAIEEFNKRHEQCFDFELKMKHHTLEYLVSFVKDKKNTDNNI